MLRSISHQWMFLCAHAARHRAAAPLLALRCTAARRAAHARVAQRQHLKRENQSYRAAALPARMRTLYQMIIDWRVTAKGVCKSWYRRVTTRRISAAHQHITPYARCVYRHRYGAFVAPCCARNYPAANGKNASVASTRRNAAHRVPWHGSNNDDINGARCARKHARGIATRIYKTARAAHGVNSSVIAKIKRGKLRHRRSGNANGA